MRRAPVTTVEVFFTKDTMNVFIHRGKVHTRRYMNVSPSSVERVTELCKILTWPDCQQIMRGYIERHRKGWIWHKRT